MKPIIARLTKLGNVIRLSAFYGNTYTVYKLGNTEGIDLAIPRSLYKHLLDELKAAGSVRMHLPRRDGDVYILREAIILKEPKPQPQPDAGDLAWISNTRRAVAANRNALKKAYIEGNTRLVTDPAILKRCGVPVKEEIA